MNAATLIMAAQAGLEKTIEARDLLAAKINRDLGLSDKAIAGSQLICHPDIPALADLDEAIEMLQERRK